MYLVIYYSMVIHLKSQNARGLAEDKKRRELFHKFHKSKFGIFLVQETHSTAKVEQQWKNEWGGTIIFSHGSSNSRGTCILFKNNINMVIHGSQIDTEGRYVIIDIEIDTIRLTLASVYGPNEDNPEFFLNFVEHIESFENDNRIIAGDWNFVLDLDNDKKGGLRHTNFQARDIILAWMEETDMIDLWRHQNPDSFVFTWKRLRPHPGIFCRLDFILVSFGMLDKIDNVNIVPGYKTDHSSVCLSVESLAHKRGPGYWKLNVSYLRDIDYIDAVKKTIQETVQFNNEADPLLLWDTLKCQIRGTSLNFSARKKRSKCNKIAVLERRLQQLEQKLLENYAPDTEALITEVKNELNEYIEEKTRGAMIRSKCRWYEEGEKCSKYFLNLEKRNYNCKTIDRLQSTNGHIISDSKEILQEQYSFYDKLYTSTIDNSNNYDNIYQFLGDTLDNVPKLSEDMKNNMDGQILETEITNAIKTTQNGKSPGLDGIPIDFYKVFWLDIKEYFLAAVTATYENKTLSLSQKRGLISLIPKKDKNPLSLKNWRPLTLLTADYKILAKVIANRIKMSLTNIIHSDQTGFIKGRYIGENIITLLNILEYTEEEDIPALLVFVDYEKAFDSVEWSFINDCLELFNFSDTIISWVNILYRDIQTCVSNNGWFTNFFHPTRGVRQGCPLSPYLFIIASEILAIHVRHNDNIKGLIVNGEIHKIKQFADDTIMMILYDEQSLNEIIYTLNRFQTISGLKVNYDKTEILRIGSMRNSQAKFYTQRQVKWTTEPVRCLGTKLSAKRSEIVENNFESEIKKIENLIKIWEKRNITPIGKIIVMKLLLISQLVYRFSVLPSPPLNILKHLDNLLYNFLWNNKKHFVEKSVIIGNMTEGGLNMIDIYAREIAIKCSWVKRLTNTRENINWGNSWKNMVKYFIPSCDKLFWSGNLKVHHGISLMEHRSDFWEAVIRSWCIYNFVDPIEFQEIISQQIWYNSFILVNDQPVFCRSLHDAGITYIYDILNVDGNIMSCDEVLQKYNLNVNSIMVVNSIIDAIPVSWKRIIHNNQNQNIVALFNSYKSNFSKVMQNSSNTKFIYQALVSKKSKTFDDRLWIKWSIDFGNNLLCEEDDISNAFSLIKKTTLSPVHRYFQFRVIHRILVTNKNLQIWKLKDNSLCTFCKNDTETIYHVLWECNIIQRLWEQIFHWLHDILDSDIRFNSKEIILGINDEHLMMYNAVFVITKQYIYACKCKDDLPNFDVLITKIKYYIRLEKYIATKIDKLQIHYRKWGLLGI